jgi:hypothetical protein
VEQKARATRIWHSRAPTGGPRLPASGREKSRPAAALTRHEGRQHAPTTRPARARRRGGDRRSAATRGERSGAARARGARRDGETHPQRRRAERGGERRHDGARRWREEADVEEAQAAKGEGRGGLESSEGMEEVLRALGIGRRWSDGGGLRRRAARTGRGRGG